MLHQHFGLQDSVTNQHVIGSALALDCTIRVVTYRSIAVVSAPAMRRFEAVISISSYEIPFGVFRVLITCSMLRFRTCVSVPSQ